MSAVPERATVQKRIETGKEKGVHSEVEIGQACLLALPAHMVTDSSYPEIISQILDTEAFHLSGFKLLPQLQDWQARLLNPLAKDAWNYKDMTRSLMDGPVMLLVLWAPNGHQAVERLIGGNDATPAQALTHNPNH